MKQLLVGMIITAFAHALAASNEAMIEKLHIDRAQIQAQIEEKKSIWLNAYANYNTHKKVTKRLVQIKSELRTLSKGAKTPKSMEQIKALKIEEETLLKQLDLLPNGGNEPFTELIKTQEIPLEPAISDPFEIFTGFSYIKTLTQLKEEYHKKKEQLVALVELLEAYNQVVGDLADLDAVSKEEARLTHTQVEDFTNALHMVASTGEVYSKRIDDLIFRVTTAIGSQAKSVFVIVTVIVILIVLAFLLKMVIKKYIKDNERFYMANKVINFTNFFIIVMILFMNYIENVGYLVTVLGFASAGIAIAMKDWFMSVLGWLVIIVGGSIHVGDRVKFQKNGMEYVGDVLDISLLRITMLEDVTLTTYMANRRAGRIVFIPNNYVFTEMIANYSHNSLKTVWDGIDITITFDSNHKKATYLAKEIARKYSKGYTDITRKQLNKLRDRYSLKNANVEPRVFAFAESYGIKISSWYLTNAFATLTLRSTISTEIIDAFNAENDIHIAYPTQTIGINQPKPERPHPIEGTIA